MSMRSPAPSLGKVEFLVLLWTTFAAFAALYGPQPLLPVIQQHFGVGSQSASLLMTLAILPLGLAPVCYGYILNLCSTRRLLQLTTALCALVLLAASFTTAFWQLLALRTLTGPLPYPIRARQLDKDPVDLAAFGWPAGAQLLPICSNSETHFFKVSLLIPSA